jgi:hypothetical protein
VSSTCTSVIAPAASSKDRRTSDQPICIVTHA